MRKTVLTIVLLTLVISCKNPKSETSQDQDLLVKGERHRSGKQPCFQKIKTETVSEQEHSDGVVSARTIQAIPNHYAEIASPFSGRITQSFIRLGQMFQQTVLFLRYFLLIIFRFRKIIQMP
jgi:cobalt-zinc-cadmium efflux system membrane fusion protein